MRNCRFLVFTFLALLSTYTEAESRTMKNPWFSNTACNMIEIKKFKSISDHQITKSVSINDADAIKSLMQRIAKIPAGGNMMKSFSDEAEEIRLAFHCENKIQEIGIFNKRFQTPSTGFNPGKNQLEEDLYHDIDALLFPDFNKRILKIKNLALPFKGFTVTYKGSSFEDANTEPKQITCQRFTIKDRIQEQDIEIRSGQIEPQPRTLDVRLNRTLPFSSTITFYTHQSGLGKNLYPDYFQISK